jgi:hypothetical protein
MNLANGEVYSIQSLNFVSDLRQVYGFLGGTLVSSTNENDRHDITKILLKVALNIFCFKSICPCDPPRGLHTYVLVTHPRGLYIYVHMTHPRGLYIYVHVTNPRGLYIYMSMWPTHVVFIYMSMWPTHVVFIYICPCDPPKWSLYIFWGFAWYLFKMQRYMYVCISPYLCCLALNLSSFKLGPQIRCKLDLHQ